MCVNLDCIVVWRRIVCQLYQQVCCGNCILCVIDIDLFDWVVGFGQFGGVGEDIGYFVLCDMDFDLVLCGV